MSVRSKFAFCRLRQFTSSCLVSKLQHTSTLPRLLATKRQHVATVAAPFGRDVAEGLETMRNAMVQLGLLRVALGVGFADALGDDLGVAFLVAHVLAVGALHAVLAKLATKGTAHDVVKALKHELVAKQLVNVLLSLADGALALDAAGRHIERLALARLLGEVQRQLYAAVWLE